LAEDDEKMKMLVNLCLQMKTERLEKRLPELTRKRQWPMMSQLPNSKSWWEYSVEIISSFPLALRIRLLTGELDVPIGLLTPTTELASPPSPPEQVWPGYGKKKAH
jgi:hypothetical protein